MIIVRATDNLTSVKSLKNKSFKYVIQIRFIVRNLFFFGNSISEKKYIKPIYYCY